MDKLLNKWYFGLIVIPILINILTNTLGLSDLFKEWNVTIIATLSFLIFILITEIVLISKRVKVLEFKPKESDKKIVNKLLQTLDVESFHRDIKNQNSWYGYDQEAIGKIIDFAEDAGLINNRTSDISLNTLILELKSAIDDFNLYSGTQLYGNGKFYSPAKDTVFNIERAKKAQPIMNEKANFAFIKLSVLLDYLKRRNYLE